LIVKSVANEEPGKLKKKKREEEKKKEKNKTWRKGKRVEMNGQRKSGSVQLIRR
jgi:hypothetical protein